MKKNKIISLIFVCAFLVLTFCCSFAGKIVDVEVTPPLRAVGSFPSSLSGIIFKIDLDSVTAGNYWDDGTSYLTGYFNFRYVSGVYISFFDSSGNLFFSGSPSALKAGLNASSGSGVVSLFLQIGTTEIYNYTSGVYYIRYDSPVPSSYPLTFYYGTNMNMSTYTAPVNSAFLTIVDSLPEPVLPTFDSTAFFDLLISSVTDTAIDLSTVFSNLASSLFIVEGVSNSYFSPFGVIMAIMLGVSITLGLCNIVLDYILTLGRKKR